jgi:dsRNA-specific ribonuclease
LLQERCVALGWPLPFYEVVQSGPAHAPEFRAVVRITTPSGDLASDPATAGVRKEAEKLAAANMLRLSVPASPLFHE